MKYKECGLRWLIKQLIRYGKPYYKIQLITSILVIVSWLLNIPAAYAIKDLVDKVVASIEKGYFSTELLKLAVIALTAYLVSDLTHLIGESTYVVYQHKAAKDFSLKIFRKVVKMSLLKTRKISLGDYTRTLYNDARVFGAYAASFIPAVLLHNALRILVPLYIMATLCPLLLPLPLSLAILNYFYYKKTLPSFRDYEVKYREVEAKALNTALETVLNHLVVKARGVSKYFLKKLDEHFEVMVDLGKKTYLMHRKRIFLNDVIAPLQPFIVLALGSYLVVNKLTTLGALVTFAQYCEPLFFRTAGLYSILTDIYRRVIPSAIRVVDFLEEEEEVGGWRKLEKFDSLELRNVFFRYDDADVLKNISLVVGRGEKIAVVGRTGSGKTTLALLMSGFLKPSEGRVLINGIDAREYILPSPKIAYVPHEAPLFSDMTLRENILLGRSISEEELLEVVKVCCLEELLDKLDARVGRGGVSLSDGQKQRVNLARAILDKPYVLILDEALAAVDSETEKRIFNNLFKYLPNTTFIVISHRLSTITYMNKIIVLENGKIAGQGTHKQLIKTNQTYRKLIKEQIITEK